MSQNFSRLLLSFFAQLLTYRQVWKTFDSIYIVILTTNDITVIGLSTITDEHKVFDCNFMIAIFDICSHLANFFLQEKIDPCDEKCLKVRSHVDNLPKDSLSELLTRIMSLSLNFFKLGNAMKNIIE